MASVSFAALDQDFFIADVSSIEFLSYSGVLYDYVATGGHRWSISGAGLTQTGGLLDGGMVDAAALNLDGDASLPEISITGLSVGGASVGVGVGFGYEQTDRMWSALLGGDDAFSFVMADYNVGLAFNGDGAGVSDGATHVGGDDRFSDRGQVLAGNVFLAGDWDLISFGHAVGGDDRFSVGAFCLQGDFSLIAYGASAVGGADVIAPARLTSFLPGYFLAEGDAEFVHGALTGGADVIDLRATSLAGFFGTTLLLGDAYYIGGDGTLTGGDDRVWGSAAGDAIHGDYIFSDGTVTGGDDSLSGFAGDDTIFGNEGDDAATGGDGDDILAGGAGADALDGGLDLDTVDYSAATGNIIVRLWNSTATGDITTGDRIWNFENVLGGAGDDAIVGSDPEANALIGNGGDDTMLGLAGDDVLAGEDGDDVLQGGFGLDVLDGGAGVDTVLYSEMSVKVTVRLWNQTASGGTATGDTIAGIENVFGGLAGDAIAGSDQTNLLAGGAGNDSLYGLDLNDTLAGGVGHDLLRGGAGADVLVGEVGIDTLDYSDALGAVTVRLWNNTAAGDIAAGDAIAGFENVMGGAGNDAIAGSDLIANRLFGNAGADALSGLSGDDTLTGAAGGDTLTGGTGADRFDFGAGFGADRILDFAGGAGAGDVCRIVGFGAAFDSFTEVLAAATQVGGDTVIALGGGNSITLVGVSRASLAADDFVFI